MLRPLAALLALVALVAAGCGGGSDKPSKQDRATYTKQIDQVRNTLNDTFTSIGEDITKGSSAKQIGDKLDEGSKALENAANQFDKIDAPSDAQAAHDKLVDGLHKLSDVFAQSAAAARKGDTAELAKSLQNVQNSTGAKEITQATDELRKKGYNLNGGG
jgi:hypothetical protein